MRQPECTPEQGKHWETEYGKGARAARHDVMWNEAPRVPLEDAPPEMPGENGAQYVARHWEAAWRIAYVSAYRWARAHRSA